MRSRLLQFAAVVAAMTSPALAGIAKPVPLELWINGVSTHRTLLVQMEGAAFVVAREDLAAEGLVIAGNDAQVTIGVHSDVRATVDEANQRLMINAPAKSLKPKVFDLRPPAPPKPDAPPVGFTLNYDISAETSDLGNIARSSGAGTTMSGSMFTPYGVLVASGFGRLFDGGSQGARLDSIFIVDDPDHALRWSIGDAISGGLPWSRPLRFAGFQIATDYSLRPDLVTMPLPQFFGETAVPAAVDVFVGAARVFETDVDPGPFELRDLPVLTGASDAMIVISDILGRQTTATIPLYDTRALLAPGLNEYSFEAGVLRRGYGIASFDYSDATASGTLRRGITPTLTIQAHAELARDVQMGGSGFVIALEPYGTIHFDAAVSTRSGDVGDLLSGGFESRWNWVTAFGSYTTTSNSFADLTSITGTPMDSYRTQLGLSAGWKDFGSISISKIDQSSANGSSSRIIAGSYSIGVAEKFFSLTAFYDQCTRHWYAAAALNVLLGDRNTATASGSLSDSAATATIAYEHEGDPDGGIGYRASASAGQNAGFDAEGVWYGNALSANVGISSAHSQTGIRAGIDGSLIALDGSLFAARQSDGSVALVKTGLPGIPIYQENRPVAVTDEDGEALVPGLVPFAANRISVNPDDFPITTIVETNERIVAPRRRSAAIVDLTPRSQHPALVVVRLENGLFPPLGARVTLERDAQTAIVGRSGKIFIADLRGEADVSVTLPDGTCRFHVALPPKPSKRIVQLGPYLCAGTPLHAS